MNERQEQKREERDELEKMYGQKIITLMDDRKVTARSITYYDLVVELRLITESSDERQVRSAKNFVKRIISTIVKKTNPRIMSIPVAGGGWRLINASKKEHVIARQEWLNLMAKKLIAKSQELEPVKTLLEATTERPEEKFTPILKGEQLHLS